MDLTPAELTNAAMGAQYGIRGLLSSPALTPLCPTLDVSLEDFKNVINIEVIGSFNPVRTGIEIL